MVVITLRRAVITAAAAAMLITPALACNTDAAPKTCVELAQEAGAPELVIDYMRRPLDSLNAVERTVVRTALNELGLGEACDAMRQALE